MAEERFVNQAYLSVTESAPNTLTFAKLETGISVFEKVGWLISRIDWFILCTATQFGADSDGLWFGISVMDTIATVTLGSSAVVDMNSIFRRDWGAAASGTLRSNPVTKSFADLPGGGLLVPPNPLYVFAQGVALAAAQVVECRMFYTVKTLKTEDFWELVEQRRMIGA